MIDQSLLEILQEQVRQRSAEWSTHADALDRPEGIPECDKPAPLRPPPATFEEAADRFEEEFLPRILLCSSKLDRGMDLETIVEARRRYMKAAGNPSDALERSLVDSVFFLQFRSVLCYQFAVELDPKGHQIFGSLAIKMVNEMRKTALAIQKLRGLREQRKARRRPPADKELKTADEGDNYAATDTRSYKAVEERRRPSQPGQAPRPVRRRASQTA